MPEGASTVTSLSLLELGGVDQPGHLVARGRRGQSLERLPRVGKGDTGAVAVTERGAPETFEGAGANGLHDAERHHSRVGDGGRKVSGNVGQCGSELEE